MSRRFERAFAWTVDYPWVTLLVILTVSAVALLGYIDPNWPAQLLSPAAAADDAPNGGNRPAPRAAADVERFSLTDADAVLVVDSEDFFSPEGAAALRDVVDRLEQLDFVRRVMWMDRVPVLNIFGLREALFPPAHASARRFQAARDKAMAHPLVGGQLLSTDGRTLLMLIRFNWLHVRSDADCTDRIKAVAIEAAADHPGVQLDFLLTGRVPMYLAFMESQQANQRKYQIIGYGMVAFMALVLFRGVRAVLIVSFAPSLGVFWSLGFLRYFGVQDNPFNDIVLPVMVSLVGMTDGVHLMVETRKQRAAGLPERAAARAGIAHVGFASSLTCVTTAIGFASLGWARHEVVKEFGWSCALGSVLTFLAVITIIPLACSTRLGRRVHVGIEHGLIERQLHRVSSVIAFVIRRKMLFSTAGIVITATLALIALQLRPDERRTGSLPSGSEAVRAIEHMDRAFGGLERGEVVVHWSNADAASSPELLVVLGEVHDLLRRENLIGSPLSIHNLLAALPGVSPVPERMSMLELLPPPLKDAFYVPGENRASVSFRVQDLGIAAYGPVFTRLQTGLEQIAANHPQYDMHLDGSAVDRWRNLYQIVVDLSSSLGSESVIIFGVLMLVYRSVRMGLIAIIPNLFPLVLTAASLVFVGLPLELVTVCAFTVCLGIAVDDTIHFITRYLEEREHSPHDEAILRAFTATGTGMIMTTVVLVSGFLTVLFSDLRDQRIFCAMGALTLSTAIFGDILFLPALLARWGRPQTASPTPAAAPSASLAEAAPAVDPAG